MIDLNSYLVTDEGNIDYYVKKILIAHGHIGYCYKDDIQYIYRSEIACKIYSKRKNDGGWYFKSEPVIIKKCTRENYSAYHYSCLLLAVWCGFSDKVCYLLANRNRTRMADLLLHRFLCGDSYENIKYTIIENNSLSLNPTDKYNKYDILKKPYIGKCYIYQQNQLLTKALKESDVVIPDNKGNKYITKKI